MNTKYAVFAFRGETICFAHALLNALDMKKQGFDVKLIIEGTATQKVKELADPKEPFANLYAKAKEEGLIAGVCKACASKTGSAESAGEQGLTLLAGMSGHPGFSEFLKEGYEIITL